MSILRFLSAFFMTCCFLFSAGAVAAADEDFPFEPFSHRNQGVPAMLFLPFEPAPARTLQKGALQTRLDVHYSNISTQESNANGSLDFDIEFMESTLRADYGITDRFQLGISIPYRYYWGGFLDGFIEGFHDFFGFPDGGRESIPNDLTHIDWQYRGSTISAISSSSHGLGDISLIGKYALLLEGRYAPAVSAIAHVRFPTGDEDEMLGAGRIGYGGGLAADKRFGRFVLNANLQYFVLDQPDSFGELEVKNSLAYSFMTGYRLIGGFIPMIQVNGATPLFEDTGLGPLDKNLLELIVGFQLNFTEATRFQFGFVEDPISGTSPDFSVFFGLIQAF